VNERLAAACRKHGDGYLIPFGCVNPQLSGWEKDMQRCQEIHRMPGIRLYPNYHGYLLTDPAFIRLLTLAANRGMIVQIALSMEDQRTQFSLMPVAPVDPKPLAKTLAGMPKLKLMLLNAGYWDADDSPEIRAIRTAPNVWLDIAMNEGVGGLDRLVAATDVNRVVFGSHAPFFYFEAALLKVLSTDLPLQRQMEICTGNARQLLKNSHNSF
jgi:predicted TIM-barrel fold metal-dependent hydrolase